MDSLIAANTKFCFDLFQEISKGDRHKNMFFCPLSISAAFGMVRLGARSGSAHQIDKDNSSNDEYGVLSCYFGQLLSKLGRIRADYTLSIANRLYGAQEFPVCPEYLGGVIQFYHTTIESVDFRKDVEESRQEINFWVESQSQGKIKELLSKDSVNHETALVLVNAVYFKAKWEKYFDCENTVDALFIPNENEKKSVKMMNQMGLFRIGFIEEVKAQILEMRYKKGKLSMFVLLPSYSSDNLKGLEELEKKITYEKILDWTSPENMSEETVAVSFPQFTLEDSYDLSSLLQGMGVTDIFDETKANLSGISLSPNLLLSKAIHRAFVEVDEDGTQTVAASGEKPVDMEKSKPSYVIFNANHPFVFLIRHNKTKTILFYGRVCSP